ncbi:MAG: hypothetical protein ABIH23_33885 [bacterium]
MKTNIHKSDILLFLVILLFLNAIIYIDVRHFAVRGLRSQLEESIELSSSIVHEHRLPQTAFYPPGVPILLAAVRFLGCTNINPYVFNGIMLNLGAFVFYLLSRVVIGSLFCSFAAVLLMILNPYFVCTALLSRDGATEYFFTALLFLILFTFYKQTSVSRKSVIFLFLALFLTAAALGLVRVTGFFVAFAIFAVSIFIHKSSKLFFGLLTAAFACFTLLFMLYNYALVGSFSLSTNSGINLYIGNHPLYLHGHPHYDIDVFLGERVESELKNTGVDSMSESESDAYYRKKAEEFIQEDILGFVYRILVKSVWHWFNVEIIPNFTVSAHVDGNSDTIVIQTRINLLTSLSYVIYKLAYLPLFIISIVMLCKGRMDRHLLVFYMPYLALWPIVVLTFPDTRFKIVAEVCALIPMMCCLCGTMPRIVGRGRPLANPEGP